MQDNPGDTQVNVLIAGAGPAGATTSLFLCKANIPHVIIDKAVFPRDKICGDALSGKVLDVLRRCEAPPPPEGGISGGDSNIIEEIMADKNFLGSYGVKFASPDGNYVDIPFKISRQPAVSSRQS